MLKVFTDGASRMKLRALGLVTAIAATTALAGTVSVAQASPPGASVSQAGTASIDPAVQAALNRGETPAVLVKFRGKADLSAAFGIHDRDARATYVYQALQHTSDQAQDGTRQVLASQFHLSQNAHDYTVLWIDNSIAIAQLTPSLLSSLQADSNIASVRLQRVIPLPQEPGADAGSEPNDAVNSLVHIQVPEVWAEGYKGAGVVVANIDTGVRHTHHALVNQYRGNIGGGSFDHNFNWYDPYNHSATPRNSDPHGSHTMGTMIGDDGGTNQVGAAPEGKWMACIGFGFQGSSATDAGLLECGQWTLAPYSTTGSGTPDPTKHADIVNNSWGDCSQTYDDWYEGVIDGWIAAGIAPVFSNGNAPNCGYPNNPPLNTVGNPARSGKVLGVGSTGTVNGLYAPHSNKGPTDNPNPGLPTYPDPMGFANLKPNVVAPGVSIRSASSTGDDAYFLDSGTSMSAPATVGTIALMWSAADCIKGDYATTGTLLMSTAVPVPVHTGSPSDGPGDVPNQATGWGEINALAAVNAAVAHCGSGGTDPIANVTPSPMNFTVATGASTSDPLTIANTGGGTLTWSLTEAAAAAVPANGTHSFAGNGVRLISRSGGASLNNVPPHSNPAPTAVVVDEGFDDVTTLDGAGWFQVNNSNPLGLFDWGQGNPVDNGDPENPGPFDAFDGAPNAYIAANFQSTDDDGTINNWLVSPPIDFATGASVSFYTRTADDAPFADRLEIRLCTADPCTNVGSTDTDVGDFGTLLLSINPNLEAGGDPTGQNGYPTSWTQFTIDSGLPTSGTGRIAFRYFVTDGGPLGSNSDFIGLDRVVIDNGTGGGGGVGCENPSNVPWLSESLTSGSVDGGDSQDSTITVDASALSAGIYSSHLCVATNDATHALVDVPVTVTVTGGGTDPVAAVAPGSMSFTLAAGANTTSPLTIANVGGGSLTWTASDSADCANPVDVSWLSEAPTSGTAAGGSSQSSTVSVNASGLAAGSYSGHICVATNDTAHALVDVPVSLTVTGGGGGANGIVLSGPLNHAVADNLFGTTLNIVSSAFDDTGPTSGDWDFNFYDIGGFSFYTIDTYDTQYVVDGSGDVAVMHVGDVVGPASTFSNNAATGQVPTAPEWVSGTDGYAGVRFHCDGRLPNPVAGGICYGFVHITTTSGSGFPATVADTGFDGDGNPMTIVGGAAGGDPSATVTPSSLSMTVAANATATDTLNIANAAGSDPLTYSIAARGTNKPKLIPHTGLAKTRGMDRNPDIGKLVQLDRLRNRPAPRLTAHHASHASTPWAPVGPDGSQTVFQVDDGSYEDVIGLNNAQGGGNESFGAVWVNQFSATDALTIDSISIEWPSTSGVTIGMQPNLLVYYDAGSTGDLTQAVRLGTDTIVTIGSLDAFETYTTNFSVPGAGDVYIGFDDAWALVDGGFEGIVSPAAIDENSSPGAAWVSGQSAAGVLTDLNNLANNDLTGTAAGFGFAGNWLVRATGTGGGSGGPCTGPIVNWLSAAPASGSVNGGADADVTITANPTAGGLAAGTYSGEVCITTNDPAHALISVPVSLTVTAVVGQGCNAADSIFCDGFDGKPTGGDVVSGTINQPVAADADGSSFDFALEDYHPYNPSISTDDINLYYLDAGGADGGPPGMYVYWYGDAVPPEFSTLVGGVVDSGGVDFAVLHTGDTVGPSSTLSAASISMTNWIGGADGYIGVAFYNEDASAVNYGYIHVTTTGPQGFPAQALEWAYDSSGAAITIP